ncbi:MAG: hypothetical protein V7645_2355, partial [Actinomycetota bacterium]
VVGIIFLVIVLVSPGGLMGIWDRAFVRLDRSRRTGPPDQAALGIESLVKGGT